MPILVIGGSGNIGRRVIGELLRKEAEVRALVRDPAAESEVATVLRDGGVELVEGDLERPASLVPAIAGCDAVFVITPHFPEMPRLQGNAVQVAAAVGARVVKVSGWSPSVTQDSPCPGGRGHWEVEEQIKATGTPYTLLQSNYFMQNLFNRNASTIIANDMLAGPLADARISMVDAMDVAEVAACALTSDAHDGMTYTLSGPAAVTYADIAQTLSEALGRTIRYEDMGPDDFGRWMLDSGRAQWEVDHVLPIFEMYREGAGALVTDHVERVIGRPPRSLAEVVQRDLDHFRSPASVIA